MQSRQITSLAGTLGIVSCTTFFTMNSTINYITVPCLMLGGAPKAPSQSPSPQFLVASTSEHISSVPHILRQWQELLLRGHRVGPASAIFSGATFLCAGYFSPTGSMQQRIYVAGAVAALSVVPFTLLVILPINENLEGRASAVTEAMSKGDGEGKSRAQKDDPETMALIRKWVGLSKIRASMAFLAACLGVAASVL